MKKTFKRMVTCIFSALLTVNSVMPAYANEQPISEPLSSTLNVSVIGSGQVKVTENGNETVVTTETPFSQSYAEGTNVKIEAIATEGNVIENFTNNDVAVPEFVAEQNNLKIEYVTGVENSNFVVTFKEIVSSEEQETNEKVDTEPIEQPEAEGETTKEDSIETEEKDKTKDKVDKNSKLLINDETFIPNRPVSAEEQQILNDYQNGMTMKEEYIQKRKEIVDKIHAWKYVDDNYFITAKFYEDYDTANLLLGLGASILIAPDFRYSESASSTYSSDRSLSSPVVTYFEEGGHTSISNGIGSVWGIGGFWKVDGHVAFCGEAMYAPPRAGMTLNSAVEVHDDRVRKVIYYAYGYPNNQVSNTFPNRDQALLAMNEFLSAVASGTSISGSTNGQRYHVAYESLKGILNLPSPPSDFKVYKAKCPGTGVSWQGIVTQNQTLYWGQNEPKGNLTIEKSSANPSITDNNNCYSLEGAEYGLYNSEADANKDVNRVGTFKIKADGKANTIKDLKAKTYYLKETKAGKGYALDKKVYSVSVTSGKTEVYKVKDIPQSDQVGILLKKRDKETGQDVPQRDAHLENAEFTVKYYKGDYAEGVDPATQGATPERTWVLKTDENGFTYYDDSFKVSGDALYYSSDGNPSIPVGTVTMQETKAPEGYKLNDELFVIKLKIGGTNEILNTYQEPIVPEQVIKGKIRIAKKDKDTGKVIQVAGTVFDIYYDGKVVSSMTTDETGYAVSEPLAYGEYVIKEAKAPYNYLLNGTSIPFEIKKSEVTSEDEDGDAYIVVTMEDTRVKGSISFEKRGEVLVGSHEDENGNIVFDYEEQGLEGMTVTVYAKEDIIDPADGTVIYKAGEVVTTATTDKSGKTQVDNLYLGSYIVRETQAPEGFVISDKEYEVTLSYKDDHTAIISDSVTYLNDRQKVHIDLRKVDEDNEANLQGAVFGLYASEDIYGVEKLSKTNSKPLIIKKGTLIETATSDENGQVVFNADLPLSKYEIRELKAPIGYASSDEVIPVDATYKGQELPTIEIVAVFKNKITQVEFSKVDASTNEELEGATQIVYPKGNRGEVFETWVSTKEPHIIKGLEVGQTYIWEEISAPYGFALAEKIEFTVKDTGEVQVAGTMKDEIVYGQLAFEKKGKQFTYTDIGMTDLGMVNTPVFEEMNILGAEITIYAGEDITLGNGITYYKADEEIDTLVSDYEAVQSIKLPVGKYYYVETKAPIGFVKNEEKHYFEVVDNQINELQVIESILKNERPVYNINMTKQMEFSDTAMNKEAYKDVVFGIYTRDDTYDWKGNVAIEPDTLLATSGIDEEGHLVHTPELPVGNYYLKELQTNSAYKLDENEYDFSIDQSNEKAVIVPINEGKPIINKLKEYYVLVNKVDENTMKNIISKEFEFTSFTDAECKNPIETKQANTKDGTVKFVLNYGTTYIKETKAPLGYSLSPEVVKVEVNDDGLFVNGKKVERSEDLLYSIIYKDSLLPVIQTGAGSDSMLFIVAGLGVLVSLIGILEYRRRNKNKKSENKSE